MVGKERETERERTGRGEAEAEVEVAVEEVEDVGKAAPEGRREGAGVEKTGEEGATES